MRWFLIWLAAVVSIAIGLMTAYLGPSLLPAGKAFAYSPLGSLMTNLPLPLIVVGLIGIVGGVAGIWWSKSRPLVGAIQSGAGQADSINSIGIRSADMAARAGLVLAIAALACEILFHVGILMMPWSHIGAPGLAGIIPAVGFAAWPAALGATLMSWPALMLGTGRLTALLGVTLGSVTLVWLPAWFLLPAFGPFGGD